MKKRGSSTTTSAVATSEALLRLGATSPAELRLSRVVTRYIRSVVDACDGNRSVAARLMGIPRRTLQRKLAKALAEKKAGKRRRRAR
jgi:ActR/RegA family two-component response regulator